MNRRTAGLTVTALAALAIAGCSSSGSSSATATATARAPVTASAMPSVMTGTETFTSGMVTNPKTFETNSPVVQLAYTGPVTATGSFSLGGNGPVKGQYKTFATSKGNLVLQVVSDTTASKIVSTANCMAQNITVVHYTVAGSKSTGSWAGATGSGVVTATFQSNSELAGKCSLANNAQPVTLKGAYLLFLGTGPMTIQAAQG
jgi:hypothetical protein